MKTAASVAMAITIIVVTAAAIFAVYNVNPSIQSKPNPVQVTNYSAEISTLKPQISSLSNNIISLGTVKSDISDIKGKLSDLETKISQQVSSQPAPIMILLDRSSYFPGDTIHITAAGIDSQRDVQIQLVDHSGFVIMYKDTSSDSTGKVAFDFPLSITVIPGNFQVKLVSGQQIGSQPITIMIPSVTYSSWNAFTVQTDYPIYQRGEQIRVTGVGEPYTTVKATLTSPSGIPYQTAVTTTDSNGSYILSYSTLPSFETGYWYITATNKEHTTKFSIFIGSGKSPQNNSFTFTANTDKTIYEKGDMIRISGIGGAFTTVKAILTSPSGKTYNGIATTNSDGSYDISYSTLPSFETGNWYIILNNDGISKVISIFLNSN